jgi:hypothetical protein
LQPGHDFFYFFFNPALPQARVGPLGLTGFQNYGSRQSLLILPSSFVKSNRSFAVYEIIIMIIF